MTLIFTQLRGASRRFHPWSTFIHKRDDEV